MVNEGTPNDSSRDKKYLKTTEDLRRENRGSEIHWINRIGGNVHFSLHVTLDSGPGGINCKV